MRVAGVEVERSEAIPLAIPMRGGTYEAVILKLRAGGLTGYGEAASVPGRGPTLRGVLDELTNARPLTSAPARFARETALLDLEGRARGVRAAEVLGGVVRERVVCCALVGPDRAADVAAQVEEWRARGFDTFKLKSANQGGPVDLERLGAARWASGREGRLRVDFNGALTLEQAASVLPSLAHFGLELVEQPLPADAAAASWPALTRLTGMELAADESLADAARARELASAGVGLAIKLATVGGPRAALDLARAARGPLVFGSSYETSIGLAAALHTACACPAEPLASGLGTAGLLEKEVAPGLAWDGSALLLPSGPGLGVEPDPGLLAYYRLDR